MVYASEPYQPVPVFKGIPASLTNADDQSANSGACDGVLDEIGSTSAKEGGRCAHARIIVGGLEWSATECQLSSTQKIRRPYYPIVAHWRRR